MYSTELFLQTLIAGVIIGVLYALMALGITFIYSIVKMINWAMGEFYMIGSYVQYFLIVELLGPDLWFIAAPLAAFSVFLVGYVLEPPLIKPMFTAGIERKDDWDKAHQIVMDEGGKDCAWVHAYLHRVEGDQDNAGYWYRQARRPVASGTHAAEWDAIAAALLETSA